MRGQLTDAIKQRARELLGYDITVAELRMMPYVQYVMVNEQRIDPRKCNAEDREVLQRWRESGHIKGGASGLSITREFWDIINELVFLSYVMRGEAA